MFVPAMRDIDVLERNWGPEHALFDWRRDFDLRERWPSRTLCKQQGWNQRVTVAKYHWVAIAGRGWDVELAVSDSWKDPGLSFFKEKTLRTVLVVLRVNCRVRLSQYLGWIAPHEFQQVPVVNLVFPHEDRKTTNRMRRMLIQDNLNSGFPKTSEIEKQLFE